MPPKPFPFPLSVGSDICSMERIGSIVHAPTSFNRFARRVFTRLEWPSLLDMISKTGAKHLISNRDYAYRLEKRLPILYLPTIDISNTILTGEEKSNEGELVRYLAGRYAAKEAAIKAHRYRRLMMSEISIVEPRNKYLLESMTEKPSILIDPHRQDVVMNAAVANIRGLRTVSIPHAEEGVEEVPYSMHCRGAIMNGEFVETKSDEAARLFKRRARTADEDRQLADVSISHDGKYAMAVCIALDEKTDNVQLKPPIIDDGTTNPLHEPEWGDEGWFGPEDDGNKDDDEAKDGRRDV